SNNRCQYRPSPSSVVESTRRRQNKLLGLGQSNRVDQLKPGLVSLLPSLFVPQQIYQNSELVLNTHTFLPPSGTDRISIVYCSASLQSFIFLQNMNYNVPFLLCPFSDPPLLHTAVCA